MTSTSSGTPAHSAWSRFEQQLAMTVAQMADGLHLTLSVRTWPLAIHFIRQGGRGLRMEARHHPPTPPEAGSREQAMLALGWESAGGPALGEENTTPLFRHDYAEPLPVDAIARFAVRTLAEGLDVTHPSQVEYAARDAEGPLELPSLGLKPRANDATAADAQSIREWLRITLGQLTANSDLEYDRDGDIGIRFGSAVVYARVVAEPLFIRFHAPILRDVEGGEALLDRLNDMNAILNFSKLVYRNHTVFVVHDVAAHPFGADAVAAGFAQICAIADGLDDLMQAEFGGRTSFPDYHGSSRVH